MMVVVSVAGVFRLVATAKSLVMVVRALDVAPLVVEKVLGAKQQNIPKTFLFASACAVVAGVGGEQVEQAEVALQADILPSWR